MVDDVEFMIMDADDLSRGEPDTCGDCALYVGEECRGKYEGQERYDDSEACDEIEYLLL